MSCPCWRCCTLGHHAAGAFQLSSTATNHQLCHDTACTCMLPAHLLSPSSSAIAARSSSRSRSSTRQLQRSSTYRVGWSGAAVGATAGGATQWEAVRLVGCRSAAARPVCMLSSHSAQQL